jgi:hypothetical protein
MRILRLGAASAMACGAIALFSGVAASDPPTGAPPPPDRTDVLLTPDEPLRDGRSAVWCATAQLAWDGLAGALGKDGRLELTPPADPALVEALNRGAFPRDAIDAKAVATAVGRGPAVLERAREAWARAFGSDATPPHAAVGPDDVASFAELRKDMPFRTPFRLLPDPMTFEGKEVVAFGMIHDDRGPGWREMAKQLVAYVDPAAPRHSDRGDGVVELIPADAGERIFLSSLPRGATLEATWAAAWRRVATGRRVEMDSPEDLRVPRLRVRVRDRVDPRLVGGGLAHLPGSRLREVRQSLDVSLTERGASARAEARVVHSLGLGMSLRFDRPFLLAFVRREADRPWLLAWVGNDGWMEPAVLVPPPPDTMKDLVGRWSLDRDATLAELVEAFLEIEEQPYRDPDEPSKVVTADDVRARLRKDVADTDFGAWSLEVRADATATMVAPRDAQSSYAVRVGADGLVLVDVPGERRAEELDGGESVPARLRDGRLHVGTMVFRRDSR